MRVRRQAVVSTVPLSCDVAREGLSARFDNEETAVDDASLRVHTAGCAECRSFDEALATLARNFTIEVTRDVPPKMFDELVGHLPVHRPPTRSRGWHLREEMHVPWRRVLQWGGAAVPAVVLVFALQGGAGAGPDRTPPHLSPNGCISYLLAHHLWTGNLSVHETPLLP